MRRALNKAAIEKAMLDAGGNITAAAAALGVARLTIYRELERLGIDVDELRRRSAAGEERRFVEACKTGDVVGAFEAAMARAQARGAITVDEAQLLSLLIRERYGRGGRPSPLFGQTDVTDSKPASRKKKVKP